MSQDSHSDVESPPYIYECMDCGTRVEDRHQPVACPECGGEMQNLGKPSEQ